MGKAEKLASSNGFYAVKSFLGKIGTNRIVLGKKVLLDFVEPFDLILKYKGLCVEWADKCEGKKRGQETKTAKCPPVWS